MRNQPIITALLVCAVLALAMATGHAAPLPPGLDRSPEEMVDGFLRGLSSRVMLTPQEKAAIRPILVEQTKKRQDIIRARLAANPGRAGLRALRDDMLALTRETDTRLSAVLPPAKMEKLRAYRQERLEQARGMARGARAGG